MSVAVRSVRGLGAVAVVVVTLLGCDRPTPVRADPAPPRATIEVVIPVPAPPPPLPPPSPPRPPPQFDPAAARTALAAVVYKHCALDRSARVLMRFHPAGNATVDRVATVDALPSDVDTCLIKAFSKARIPRFVGSEVSIGFLIR